jgi:hypothetical protein
MLRRAETSIVSPDASGIGIASLAIKLENNLFT